LLEKEGLDHQLGEEESTVTIADAVRRIGINLALLVELIFLTVISILSPLL
jgi:hypothetical protein